MSKAIIINGSPRKGGNSDAITALVAATLSKAGIESEVFTIRDEVISPCIGCNSCKDTVFREDKQAECVFRDSAAEVVAKLLTADIAVLVTPVYYISLPGPVKTLIDRFFVSYDPWKEVRRPKPERKFAAIYTYGGSPDEVVLKAAEVADYAFGNLGYGSKRTVLCGMSTGKDSFAGNEQQRDSVMELLTWLTDGAVAALPDGKPELKVVPSTNPLIQKFGRGNSSGELIYSGSGLRLCGKFSELYIELDARYETNEQWLAVLLNGALISRFMVQKGKSRVCLLRGLNAETAKTVTIVRETQPMVGETLKVDGFQPDGMLRRTRSQKLLRCAVLRLPRKRTRAF